MNGTLAGALRVEEDGQEPSCAGSCWQHKEPVFHSQHKGELLKKLQTKATRYSTAYFESPWPNHDECLESGNGEL